MSENNSLRGKVTVICEICGEPFAKNKTNLKQKFCSLKCAHKAAYLRYREKTASQPRPRNKTPRHKSNFGEKKCVVCGKKFIVTRANRVYCSRECYLCSLRTRQRGKYTTIQEVKSTDSFAVKILKRIIRFLERRAK